MLTRRPVVAPALLVSGVALLALGGCAHDVGGWRMNYKGWTDARFETVPKEEVIIVADDFDTLAEQPQLDGVACMGTTRFKTYGQLTPCNQDPDRTIRPHAALKGAQLVRWGMREVAPAEDNIPAQWEYVAVYYHGYWRPQVASAGN